MDTETTAEHLARLERVLVLQQKMIDKLGIALKGHQELLTAMSTLMRLEITEQSAPQASAN